MRVEVASALARRTREGRLTTERRDEIYARFLDDLLGFVVVELDEVVLVRAAVLARTSPADAPLRALDAIHLASALKVFEEFAAANDARGPFVTADRPLQRAAMWAGLPVIDPEAPEQATGDR